MLRVICDPPLPGPDNMARDEALMLRAGAKLSPPTLRLYQWSSPTISLGYFQRFGDFENLPFPAGKLAVVRRQTGGGAILHDLEWTYSLTLPVDHALLADGPRRLYDLAHDAVIAALAALNLATARCGFTDDSTPARGPFFCFARRHDLDVLLDGGKIAGSAQRRTRSAILQHGSIILGNRYPQQPTATPPLPYEQSLDLFRRAMIAQFANLSGETLRLGEWSAVEVAAAEELIPKYAGDEWTRRM